MGLKLRRLPRGLIVSCCLELTPAACTEHQCGGSELAEEPTSWEGRMHTFRLDPKTYDVHGFTTKMASLPSGWSRLNA